MTKSHVDLLIIGAGPAGLTAAQYGARAGLNVLVIEQLASGGQAVVIDRPENYPGNVARQENDEIKSGYELMSDFHKQALDFGASFLQGSVSSLAKKENVFEITLIDGALYTAAAVIIASGSKPGSLGIPGEKEFTGKGVSYCATCDGNFYKNKKIFVAGGGDAACDEAQYLSRLTDKIVLVHRRDVFRAQKKLAQRTLDNPNIEVRFNTVINEIKDEGTGKVKSVILNDLKNGKVYEEKTDAVFIFAGTVPQSSLVKESGLNVRLDESGYIITDQKMASDEPGFFAAGDIRSGAFRQVITAAADGAAAAHSAAGYIDAVFHDGAFNAHS
ncbi:MAG: FAD-dependent oxidoreductase [Treponema sp.]|nr:FAD-dependent oxidoreductase [Treponema sp.]